MGKNKTNYIMRLLLLLLMTTCQLAQAYPAAHYVGFGTGYTWTQASFNDEIRTLGAFTETPSYSDVSNGSLPWQGFMGFRFHPNYGIEVGYLTYGSISFTKTLTRVDSSQSKVVSTSVRESEISTQGFYLQHVLSYPINDAFILQGRAGILVGSSDYSELEVLSTINENDETQVTQQPNNSSNGFIKGQLAFSALYKSSNNWFWRLQLNQIDIDNRGEKESFSHWFTSLSLEYQLQE
ncbi:MAG: hypothetical protein ACJA1U_002018 [Bermanella sp.]|jgi:hypothetical protein